MTKVRMWVFETDKYGVTDKKFSVDNSIYVPRVGEFIDSSEASGWVNHVQYNYQDMHYSEFSLIINVYLTREKQVDIDL